MSSLYESFRNGEYQSKSYEEESHKFDSILHEFYHYIIYENFCDVERVKSHGRSKSNGKYRCSKDRFWEISAIMIGKSISILRKFYRYIAILRKFMR